ncbi:MAG: 30S ribosomal protein S9 [Patescibacteria group bacterium]|nr:30S ribosomal protein S9 [Patescibacteria group bacterium]
MPKKIIDHTKEAELKSKKAPYSETVGRRKTATARVRIWQGKGDIKINGRELKNYFSLERLRRKVVLPLESLNLKDKFDVSVKVNGGGSSAQADAVCHGIARALVKNDGERKKPLKKLGLLTRDSRMVERKKYGLKKARRAPQWRKR